MTGDGSQLHSKKVLYESLKIASQFIGVLLGCLFWDEVHLDSHIFKVKNRFLKNANLFYEDH